MRHTQLPLRNEWVYEATGPQIGLLLALVAVMSWVFMPNTVSAQNSYPATRVPGAGQSAPGLIPATRSGQGTGGGGVVPATRAPGQAPNAASCNNNGRCFQGEELFVTLIAGSHSLIAHREWELLKLPISLWRNNERHDDCSGVCGA